MSKKAIEIYNLVKLYKEGNFPVYAVNNLSLTVADGEYLAIVGPSGAGKSTLLHIIGGIDFPTSGDIIFNGKKIFEISKRKRSQFLMENMGFVFQFYHLIPELRVFENVIIPYLLKNFRLKEAKIAAFNVLKDLGMQNREYFYPNQLSGGEKQRVALARAFINKPRVLLCDEPTGNLDIDSTDVIRKILKTFHKQFQTTIIMVTHNLELAKDADRVLNITGGQLKS